MRDAIVSLKIVEGILFFRILWVIQCYQQLQVFVAHVNLLLIEAGFASKVGIALGSGQYRER